LKIRNFYPHLVDLHIHTVLSPCGELEMGAPEIIQKTLSSGISVIAVTDHNSTLNWYALRDAARDMAGEELLVLPGVEVQTAEDIHIIGIFPGEGETLTFQKWIEKGLRDIPNKVDIFGYQLIIDKNNNIISEYEHLLIQGTVYPIDEVIAELHSRDAIIIPAHIDRESFSYPYVLGPIPSDLEVDALEISSAVTAENLAKLRLQYQERTLLRSSDAHCLRDISPDNCSTLLLKHLDFQEVRRALLPGSDRVIIQH